MLASPNADLEPLILPHSSSPSRDIAQRVEFCGGIGVGKSTIARYLASQLGFQLIEESYDTVPFWSLHQQFSGFEFPKNIGFLIVHLEKILSTLDGEEVGKIVCDFSFTQILAYAEISGSVNEKRAFREIHQMLTARIGEPWLTVHLTCPIETQIERIKRRVRIGETVPGSAFLKRLNGQIEDELSHLNGNVIAIQLERESSVDKISRKIQKEIAKSQDFAPPS